MPRNMLRAVVGLLSPIRLFLVSGLTRAGYVNGDVDLLIPAHTGSHGVDRLGWQVAAEEVDEDAGNRLERKGSAYTSRVELLRGQAWRHSRKHSLWP